MFQVPNEIVTVLGRFRIPGVAGNYDSTVATDHKHCGCRYEDPRQEELSHLSYGWTRRHVSPTTKAYLGGLPFRIDLLPNGGHLAGPRVVLVHGTRTLNTVYWTADQADEFCLKTAAHAGMKPGDVIALRESDLPDDFAEYLRTGGPPYVLAQCAAAALGVEWLLSFALMFVIMAVAIDERVAEGFAALAVGFTVGFCALMGGPLTGASMLRLAFKGQFLMVGRPDGTV